MNQENKELLLKDLCARLPYGVKAQASIDEPILTIEAYDGVDFLCDGGWEYRVEQIKPYLFPLSSMNEEQKKELHNIQGVLTVDFELEEYKMVHLFQSQNVIDWFNKNHFDYRGLIPMGLANNATGLNIY